MGDTFKPVGSKDTDDGKEPYFFPEYLISIRASSLQEALALLQEMKDKGEV